ncbi:uncharacterized protein LOC144411842 [Styela clava]
MEQTSQINWDRLEGDWYETINTDRAVDKIGGCYKMDEIKSTKNGAFVHMIDYHINRKRFRKFGLNFVLNPNGNYVLENDKAVDLWKSDLKMTLQKQSSTKQAIFDEIAETHGAYTIYTDYKNYFISARCLDQNLEGGQKGFWIYTRSQHPDAETVLRIINVISQMTNGWNAVPLALSKCVYAKALNNFTNA